MYPIHEDIILTPEQQKLVLDYVREVDFHLPGASAEDFTEVIPRARYGGWDFMSEDLESYLVGLKCTKPGFEDQNTFIRMSYGQLMGQPDAERLPVNDPVLASDDMRMQRWRDTPTGPSRTGVDAYATTDGSVPGVDLDLRMIHDTLSDILDFDRRGLTSEDVGYFDLQVDWGVMLAGRYPRLKHFEKEGRLNADQVASLKEFERRCGEAQEVLAHHELPKLDRVWEPERRRHQAHHS